MRKHYVKPESRIHTVSERVSICCASGHDNGNHNGWNNPHNPHYPGNSNEEEEP